MPSTHLICHRRPSTHSAAEDQPVKGGGGWGCFPASPSPDPLLENLEVYLQRPVGADSPLIPGDEADTVRRRRGADQGVVDGPAGNAQGRQASEQSIGSRLPKEARLRKVAEEQRLDSSGVRRRGGGSLVSTENVSKAAWPARPRRRPRNALTACWWCSWSPTTTATATLVSTSASRPSALYGIAQGADGLIVDAGSHGGNDETSILVRETIAGDWFHPQTRAVQDHLDLSGPQSHLIPQWLRHHQPTGIINGSTHTIRLPASYR